MKFIVKNLKIEHPSITKSEDGEDTKVETEVPQFESVDEFTTAVGGIDKVLEIINTVVANASAVPARTFMKSKEAKNLAIDTVVSKIQSLRKNFSFAEASNKVTNKDKISLANRALSIVNDVNMSDADKAAAIMAALQSARA